MLGQNLRENRLDSYSDHSVSVSRDLRIRNVNTSLTVEVLNLLDKNYEIVKNFPMPGRSVSDDESKILKILQTLNQ